MCLDVWYHLPVCHQGYRYHAPPSLLVFDRASGNTFGPGDAAAAEIIEKNVAFPILSRGAAHDPEEMDRKVNELLEMLEVREFADRIPSDLSTGTKRAVAIARALAEDPDAILYDEPTTMVDPIMAAHTSELILKMKAKFRKTSIVVTHDTHLAKKLADRVIFLHEGRVEFFGSWAEFESSQDPILRNFLLQDELIPALDASA